MSLQDKIKSANTASSSQARRAGPNRWAHHLKQIAAAYPLARPRILVGGMADLDHAALDRTKAMTNTSDDMRAH